MRVTFSRKNSPLTVYLDGHRVARITRSAHGRSYVIYFCKVQWLMHHGKQIKATTRGGYPIRLVPRLRCAKAIAEVVAIAYGDRIKCR